MYIVALDPTGYIIISATQKEQPILGFSDKNAFNINSVSWGLAVWFYKRMYKIQMVRNNKSYIVPKGVKRAWGTFQESETKYGRKVKNDVSNARIIIDEQQYGPLLNTYWDQRPPYNNYVPNMGCSNTSNGRALAGCVAIAVS